MSYEFIMIEPIYTGGNIYCFLGNLDNKRYFLADSCNYDVRIVNENPIKEENDPEYEDIWYDDWQQKHLIEDLTPKECLIFFTDMIKWINDNNPKGNYSINEINYLLNDIKTLQELETWR